MMDSDVKKTVQENKSQATLVIVNPYLTIDLRQSGNFKLMCRDLMQLAYAITKSVTKFAFPLTARTRVSANEGKTLQA